jgi:hypothetical protein
MIASVHPGLKTIPTCIINFDELERDLASTHAFLVDTDGPQLFAEVRTLCPNPGGKCMFSLHIQIDADGVLTFPLPEKP